MMRVAIYIRVSTEEQANEGFSIAAQRTKLMQYCELQEWDIFDIYIDEGFSGAKLERPELTRLRQDIQNKNFDMVLVWRVDRFFRNVYYLSTFLHEMEMNKISFKSMTEGFDTSHPSGKAMLQMLAIFAEWERETIRERVTNALYERARQGYHHAVAPFGYKTTPEGKLEPDEPRANVIRDIFYMRNKDKSLFDIINYIKAKYPPDLLSENKSLTKPAHLSRILTNPIYAGKIKHNDEIFEGEHEGLVSEEVFNQAVKRKQYRPGINNFLFRGILYCGLCGAKMYTKKQGNKKFKDNPHKLFFYYCSKSKAASYTLSKDAGDCECRIIFEYVIINQVKEIIKNTSIEISEDDFEFTPKENTDEEIKRIESEIKTLRMTKNRYFEAFENDPSFENDSKERIRDISKTIQLLEEERNRLFHENKNQGIIDKEIILDAANSIDMLIENEDRESLRELYMILFKRITVHPIPEAEIKRARSFVKVEWNV